MMGILHPENAPKSLQDRGDRFYVTDPGVLQRLAWRDKGERIASDYEKALARVAHQHVVGEDATRVELAVRRYVRWLVLDAERQVAVERQRTETAEARYTQARAAFGGVPDGQW